MKIIRNSCLVCHEQDLQEIIDLGMHGLADSFIRENDIGGQEVWPLILDKCNACNHIQSRYIISPKKRYVDTEYSYTSSNSKYARDHWNQFAKDTRKYVTGNLPSVKVLEIGSNDGYLLSQYKEMGLGILGIDASPTLANAATQKGLPTLIGMFDEDFILNMKYDLIVANNVLNHSDNPISFIRGVENLLKEDGRFVFEFPYWRISIDTGKFDQIYHEHVNYFTIPSLILLIELASSGRLCIQDIEIVDYHGGSLRVTVGRGNEFQYFKNLQAEEEISGLYDSSSYIDHQATWSQKKFEFISRLSDVKLKNPNVYIVGVGAAAKANTLLTYYGLNTSWISFITDASPLKIGKMTPLTNIPIFDDSAIANLDKVFVIILSWNITDLLKSRLKQVNPNIEFIEL